MKINFLSLILISAISSLIVAFFILAYENNKRFKSGELSFVREVSEQVDEVQIVKRYCLEGKQVVHYNILRQYGKTKHLVPAAHGRAAEWSVVTGKCREIGDE